MKTKVALIFLFGVVFGGSVMSLWPPIGSYFKSGQTVGQGRALLERIHEFEEEHGRAPDAKWFYSLDENLLESEGRRWIYFEKPLENGEYGGLRLVVPVGYGRQYMGVYDGGEIVATRLKPN